MTETNHSKHLGATAGWRWFMTALQAVRFDASRLFLVVFFYTTLMGLFMIIPVAGSVLAAIFMPFGTVLIGYATRDALQKKRPGLSPILKVWSDPYVRTNLITTGLFYGLVLISAQALYGYLAEPYAAQWQVNSDDRLVWESVFTHFPWWPLCIASLLYIPGLMSTWFSPLLCASKRMSWGKALFYSFFGCLRNILPILVLGIVLIAGIAISFVIASQLIDLLGLHSINMFIYFPLSCFVFTVVYSTYWPMYEALFGDAQSDKDTHNEGVA